MNEWQAQQDALSAAQSAAVEAARAEQDEDFHALAVHLSFEVEGADCGGGEMPSSFHNPAYWEFTDDKAANAILVEQVVRQINEALAPWLAHYRGLGLIRADQDGEPSFYLVYRAEDEALAPAGLVAAPDVRAPIAALPGATLVIQTASEPINATLLYEPTWPLGEIHCDWGVPAACDRFPLPDESRGTWLTRVAMPTQTICRSGERWKRSGGSLKLFGLFGAATERAAGDLSIEWVVPGLFPRACVSLLVGTKMAGKSTFLGEVAAAIDSQCQSTRSVLGIEVFERGVSAIVSGEDGDNFINRRAEFYTENHGDPLGLVIDLATIPWPEALRLLHQAPRLDFLVIDPLRTVLDGDEDASNNVSNLFDDLNELARAKNCAIVLVHHLSKKAPRSLAAMLPAVRGSGVITDRPRVVIGMIDRGADITGVGVIKRNVPPSEQLWGEINVEQLFRRDAATLTLVPVGGHERRGGVAPEDSEALDLIYQAITGQNKVGLAVRRTGKSELFECKIARLAGLSRQATRDAVSTLVAAGRVIDGPDGLHAAAAK